MPERKFKSPFSDHAHGRNQPCDHVPQAHVVYDLHRERYVAVVRCRCRSVLLTSRKAHDGHAAAHNEAVRMMPTRTVQ